VKEKTWGDARRDVLVYMAALMTWGDARRDVLVYMAALMMYCEIEGQWQ
jgi:hypothetical protein